MRVALAWRSITALAAFTAFACDRAPNASGSPAASARSGHPKSSVTAAASVSLPDARVTCTKDSSYPTMWRVAEASAAVEIELRPGERAILALGDSDNHGDGMIWPLSPPGPLRPVKLELDTLASDDIEGAAWASGHLFTLTSSGAVRRYTPSADGTLVLDRSAYPIGPAPYLCDSLFDGNCGKNFEGLCLRPATSAARCAGYAASKADDSLYCVIFRGDALVIEPRVAPVKLALAPQALSDCAFGTAGGPAEETLVVTTNIYGGSRTYLVDESTGALSLILLPGLLNNEAVVVDRDGAIYAFMDGNTSVSPSLRATCTGWGAP